MRQAAALQQIFEEEPLVLRCAKEPLVSRAMTARNSPTRTPSCRSSCCCPASKAGEVAVSLSFSFGATAGGAMSPPIRIS